MYSDKSIKAIVETKMGVLLFRNCGIEHLFPFSVNVKNLTKNAFIVDIQINASISICSYLQIICNRAVFLNFQ